MSFLHFSNPTKKIWGIFALFVLLSIVFPHKAEAQYVDVSNAVKEYVADPTVYIITDKIIRNLTAQTVNWMNTGFKGQPAYLTNPGQFFLDIADSEASRFLSSKNLSNLCTPFNAQVRLALVKNYLNEDSQNYSCSLSILKDNYDAFTQDFRQGGWQGWFEVTQNSSNNPLGAYLAAETNLNQIIGAASAKKEKQLNWGDGFLSYEKCPEGQTVTQGYIDQALENGDDSSLRVGDCLVEEEIVTPGKTIQGQLDKVLGGPLDKLNVADEVNEIVGAFLNGLVTKALEKGLSSLSKSNGPEGTYLDQLINDDSLVVEHPNAGYVDMTPGSIICTTDEDTGVTTCNVTTGTANLCTPPEDSHGNDPGAPSTIDPNNVIYRRTNISAWSQTGSLNDVSATPANIHFEHNLPNTWGSFNVGNGGVPAFSSTWILFWRNSTTAQIVLTQEQRTELGKLYALAVTGKQSAPGIPRTSPNVQKGLFTSFIEKIKYEEDFVRFITLEKSPTNPRVWNAISAEVSNLNNKLDAIVQIYDNNDNSTLRIQKIDLAVKESLPLFDNLIAKIDGLLNPPADVGGNWIAYPFDYLTSKKRNDVPIAGLFCNSEDFEPVAGETYGFMLSTPAGNSAAATNVDNAKEKTNISTYVWPEGITRPVPTNNSPGSTGSGGNSAGTGQKPTPTLPDWGVNGGGTGTGGGSTGGGNSCPLGGGNDSGTPPPIASDFSNVVIDGNNADVSGWPISSTVILNSVTFPNGTSPTGDFCLNHNMPWAWPASTSFAPNVPANGWVFVWRSGKWHASTFEYYYDTGSQAQCRVMDSVWSNSQISGGFAPKAGETYGFMLSGLARGGFRSGSVQERSNIVMATWAGAMCTAGSGSGGSTGGTGGGSGGTNTGGGSTTPGSPTISSISPTSATSGQTTLTINGSNLTSTVQFFDSTGARTTVVGNVNSGKTQTTVLVPSGLAAGYATVKIYKDASTISNGMLLLVSALGTGGGTGGNPDPVATVSSVTATSGKWGALAQNATNNTWLIVSGTYSDIFGRIMNSDGTAVTSQFRINTDTDIQINNPKVAYAPNLNKYLVVWIAYDPGTIYGRFVNPDGTFAGGAFQIFKDAGGYSYLYPSSSLQYDSVNRKFVFVFEYRTPLIGVNLITVNENGVPSSPISISTGAVGNGRWNPSIAINTAGTEYCIAYDLRDTQKVSVRPFNPITGILGAETLINNIGIDTSIVYNSVSNKYMVGWSDPNAHNSKAKILNTCNATNGGSVFTSNSAGQTQTLGYNSKTNTFASIAQDQNDSGNSYVVMSSTGVKLRNGVAFTGGYGNFTPVIAGNTVDGTFSAISALQYDPTRFAWGI